MWSDGDNLEFDQNPLYKYWHDPARGKIPVATPLGPTLQELNPPLLDWYYSKMTDNDELVAGPAGVQFIHIRDFKDDLFPAWCKLNHDWCASAGFHEVYMWLMPLPTPKYGDVYEDFPAGRRLGANSFPPTPTFLEFPISRHAR